MLYLSSRRMPNYTTSKKTKARAVVITCIDFRFQKKIYTYLEKHHYLGLSDVISLAGGTRDFVCPLHKEDGIVAGEQLEISIRLHNPHEIIFVDHQDCGGYAMDHTIPKGLDRTDDQEQHQTYFLQLKKQLTTVYPGRKIRFFYVPLTGELEEIAM